MSRSHDERSLESDTAYMDRLERRVKGTESAESIYRRRLAELEARGEQGSQLHTDLTRSLARCS